MKSAFDFSKFSMIFLYKMALFRTLRHNVNRGINLMRLSTNHFVQSSSYSITNDKNFLNGYEEIPELQSADENVRRIFSLSNASQQEKRKVLNKELMKTCKTTKEREIAKQTISIANLEDHLQQMCNKDKHNKVFLQWLTDQRTKKLKSIRAADFERYVELIKELNIEPITSTHTKYAKYKFRRFKIGVEMKEKKSLAVRGTPPLQKKSDT